MKKNSVKRLAAIFAAALMLASVVTGCDDNKAKQGENYSGNMSESNPLYALDEVKELNANLEAPMLFGMSESEASKYGYELMENGIENHLRTYRCKEAKDVAYTFGTRELYYGEPSKYTKLYVTAMRITPEGKTIEKNADGSTTPVYTTSRSVFGIKVGDYITDARKKIASFGYETVFEEQFTGGLPKTLDNAYRKGAIMITLGAESGLGDISSIYVWIPYDEPEINKLNERSNLPVDLGNMYSIMSNPAFKYVQNSKTSTSRTYASEDGCVAIMRGFPDYRDMSMTAEVSFITTDYDVLGVKVGMSEDEAKQALLAAGCSEDGSGYFIFNSVAAVRLTCENGVVSMISACLRPSTNLSGITLSGNS